MKEEPSSDSPGRQASWPAAFEAFAIVVVAVVTVLGAVVLATQSEALHEQAGSDGQQTPTVDWIPTAAAATLSPITLIPRILTANTPQSVQQQDPTASVETPPATRDGDDGREDIPTSTSTKPGVTPTTLLTANPTATNTPWPCASGTPLGWQLYVVQKGDTLYSLAVSHGTSIFEVVKYNCLKTYQLWAGQRLYLPPPPTSTPTAPPTATGEISTPLPQPTATPSPQPTATVTPEPILLPTSTPVATLTPFETATSTLEPTASSAPDPGPTVTSSPEPTADVTSVPSDTPVPSATPIPSPTETPEPSATADSS